jgi:hypothetical protein
MNDREREWREAAELGQTLREAIGRPDCDPRYWDRDGKVIADNDILPVFKKWELLRDSEYCVIRETCTPFAELIATKWIGIEHGWNEGKPLIFETILFKPRGESGEEFRMFYATEAEAEAGHEWLRLECLAPPASRLWSRPDLGKEEAKQEKEKS